MPIEDHSLQVTPTFRLDSMGKAERLDLRAQLDASLKLDLKELDLGQELGFTFQQARALYDEVNGDEKTPANQRSQILNTLTGILQGIVKTQTELYNIERLKRLESAMLKALKTLPAENQAAFMDLYAQYLVPTAA